MKKEIQPLNLFMELINKYTTGIPFIIWGAYGFAMAAFLIYFRNETFFDFKGLAWVLAFSTCWFVASDILKKKEVFKKRLHFWVDSLAYLATFSSIFYFTNGLDGELFFIFSLIAISAPLFGSMLDATILLFFAGAASIWVNMLLEAQKKVIFDHYHMGVLILVWLIYFAIAGIIKFFQVNYIRELEQVHEYQEKLMEKNKELEKTHTKLAQDVKERTKELEQAKTGLEKEVLKRTKELEDAKTDVEKQVLDRTRELNENIAMLERINKVMIDRELKMIELKKQIKESGNSAKQS